MKTDTTVFDLIEKEHQRQLKGIELIASENFVSDEVMKAMGSWLTNKYAEGYPGKRYYGGCQVVDEVEKLGHRTGMQTVRCRVRQRAASLGSAGQCCGIFGLSEAG